MKVKELESESIINEKEIQNVLTETSGVDAERVRDILAKALELKGLTLYETAGLLEIEDPNLLEEIFSTARAVKQKIYGNRIVLFAPLYITNECKNNCLYCAFRRDNKSLERRTLTFEEITREAEILEGMGHKRLLLVFGENPKIDINYIVKSIETVYKTKNGRGEIRRINVNIAPLKIEDFRELKQAKIGTYQLFQETYHRKTYEYVHPSGPKSNYDWRITAFDRAISAGIDDVGIGVLFGLYDYKFEVLALLEHADYLEKRFGVGPHTISVPRIRPALNAPLAIKPPYPVSDTDFKKLVAVLRLSVPYTGIILSTRETASLRDELVSLGVSQISAGSCTYPGAYKEKISHNQKTEQFRIEDTRTLDEVVYDLTKSGWIPSFCTACYRSGRTGEDFMKLAKPGNIQSFCTPNAILTFKEYLLDYASSKTKEIGEVWLNKIVTNLNGKLKSKLLERLSLLDNGARDIYF
jgi:2-iminoacetate synthase